MILVKGIVEDAHLVHSETDPASGRIARGCSEQIHSFLRFRFCHVIFFPL